VTLLSQYQEDFSSYTLKQFMDDYTKALFGFENCIIWQFFMSSQGLGSSNMVKQKSSAPCRPQDQDA
jgi:hypothetical protein